MFIHDSFYIDSAIIMFSAYVFLPQFLVEVRNLWFIIVNVYINLLSSYVGNGAVPLDFFWPSNSFKELRVFSVKRFTLRNVLWA